MKNKLFLFMARSGNDSTEVAFAVRPENTTEQEAAADMSDVLNITDIIEVSPADVVEEESFAEFDELYSRLGKNDRRNLIFTIGKIANRAAVYGTLKFELALPKKA